MFNDSGEGRSELTHSAWPGFGRDRKNTGRSPYDTSHVSGWEMWRFELGSEDYSSPVIGEDDTIYLGSGSYLYAVNPDGTEKWSFELNGTVSYSPAIGEDGTIYIGSTDRNLYAVNPNGAEKWRFETDSSIRSSPAIAEDGTIYIGSRSYLYAIDTDGTEIWRFSADAFFISELAIGDDGTIYGGVMRSEPGIPDPRYYFWLLAINQNGTERWRFKVDGGSPVIGKDGTIYFSSIRNLYAIGGEDDVDKIVVDEWETYSQDLYSTEGLKTFTHEIRFENTGEYTLEVRHENTVLEQHIVQVEEKEEDSLEEWETSDERTLEQRDEIKVVKFDAPEQVDVGETENIKVEIENSRKEAQKVSLYIDDEFELEVTVPQDDIITSYEHTFSYDMRSDRVPRDILLDFSGTFDLYRHKVINVERPDSDELEGKRGFRYDGRLELCRFDREDKIGEFDENLPTIRSTDIRENIYPQIKPYLRDEYGHGNFTDPGEDDIDPVRTIFGEAQEDWLECPEPLKGEYEFTIELHGIGLEMEEAEIIFLGVSEDEEEYDIPGSIWTFLLAVVIVVEIYQKKEGKYDD